MANPANTTAYKLGDGRMAVDVTEAKTLTVDDSGYVQNVIGNVTVTLPATATLGTWTVRNKGKEISADGPAGALTDGNTVAVSPNSADKIQGGVAGTATDNKDLLTTQQGAEVTVTNGQTDGAVVTAIKGTWTREA